jgi:hypothetical protein
MSIQNANGGPVFSLAPPTVSMGGVGAGVSGFDMDSAMLGMDSYDGVDMSLGGVPPTAPAVTAVYPPLPPLMIQVCVGACVLVCTCA